MLFNQINPMSFLAFLDSLIIELSKISKKLIFYDFKRYKLCRVTLILTNKLWG
jgi:hypothetical protein